MVKRVPFIQEYQFSKKSRSAKKSRKNLVLCIIMKLLIYTNSNIYVLGL